MNGPTAEIVMLSGKVFHVAREYVRKNITEFGEVKEVSTFVAPFLVAAKMFLRNTKLTQDEQRKIVVELWDKLDYVESSGEPPRFVC